MDGCKAKKKSAQHAENLDEEKRYASYDNEEEAVVNLLRSDRRIVAIRAVSLGRTSKRKVVIACLCEFLFSYAFMVIARTNERMRRCSRSTPFEHHHSTRTRT